MKVNTVTIVWRYDIVVSQKIKATDSFFSLQISQIYQEQKTLLIYVQNLSYFFRQIGYAKRFLYKTITASLQYLGGLTVDAVSA